MKDSTQKSGLYLLLLLLLFAVPTAAAAQDAAIPTEGSIQEDGAADPDAADAQTDDDWDLRWKNTFRLDSPDGDFSLRFGGRIMNDWAFFDPDDEIEAVLGELEDGTEFRRARFYFSGVLYDRVVFKAQYDFAGGDASFRDVYIGLTDLPTVGGVRIGHFKEAFSLEELTSSKYITFMERALPIEAFSPSFNAGVEVGDGYERWSWRAGLFKDTDSFGETLSDEWNLTGRVTFAPIYDEAGRRALHLGVSASERSPDDAAVRFRSRPEAHLSSRFADTGTFAGDGVGLLDLEAAWVSGPLSFQGEWIQASVDGAGGAGDFDGDGFYVYGSYFLTGESRPYDPGDGTFGRVSPTRDFTSGPGAWEVAVRYSSLDLDDRGIPGGELEDLTFGVNWYLFPNVRTMLNYVMADLDGVGDAEVVQMRFQIDF